MFHQVLLPPLRHQEDDSHQVLQLRRTIRFEAEPDLRIEEAQIVIFDFETTGLDFEQDQIIEIGAIKIKGGAAIDQYSSFVQPTIALPEIVQNITGITPEMLEGQPRIDDVLGVFLKFIQGSILVAHNAEFDMGMLKAACLRQGIDLDWPVFCTLKMARELLPDLEKRTLDALAQHFGLEFESRHRSIGDVKVTAAVLQELLTADEMDLSLWRHLQRFYVS
jgi:DNA polymerase III epsilon subunit family exonuclease